MKTSVLFIRLFFLFLCSLFAITFTTAAIPGGFNFANGVIGLVAGLAGGFILIGADQTLKKVDLRAFNTATLGLLFGFLMAQAILLSFNAIVESGTVAILPDAISLVKITVFLICAYFGMIMTARAAGKFNLSIPFIKFEQNEDASAAKTDLIVDWSILSDGRIIELAASGLLDHHLIFPRFAFKELNAMAESTDETTKAKGKRCLEIFKKLESIPSLNIRYSDVDYPEVRDSMIKLVQLAHLLKANIVTADPSRLQQAFAEGVRVININIPSNVLKPLTQAGEQLSIKVQRYGKEPRQGVGYLDDGTMVVINGGAEFIGETIKAQVLSIKHTASGRMIFCNAVSDDPLVNEELEMLSHCTPTSLEGSHKDYCTL